MTAHCLTMQSTSHLPVVSRAFPRSQGSPVNQKMCDQGPNLLSKSSSTEQLSSVSPQDTEPKLWVNNRKPRGFFFWGKRRPLIPAFCVQSFCNNNNNNNNKNLSAVTDRCVYAYPGSAHCILPKITRTKGSELCVQGAQYGHRTAHIRSDLLAVL